jgi:hypothetical protein
MLWHNNVGIYIYIYIYIYKRQTQQTFNIINKCETFRSLRKMIRY